MQDPVKQYPNFTLTNKIALVTGAARGLGRACVLALAHTDEDIGLGLQDINSAMELEEKIIDMGRKVIRLQIETPGTEPWLKDEGFRQSVLDRIPLGRIGKPMEVAGAVVFLSSDAASLITGDIMLVDGGWTTK